MGRPSLHIGRLRLVTCVASVVVISLVGSLSLAGLPQPDVPAGAAPGVAKCSTSQLVVWLNTRGNGTAGSVYYDLEFSNLSSHACTLDGYPGVSGINLAGHQLGAAAARDPAHAPGQITLASGNFASGLAVFSTSNTATVVLRITDTANYPSSACSHVSAAGLRVYPPNQTASKVVPFPFVACSRIGPVYLHVQAVQKGITTN
jgi:hypothetical protein